MYKKHFIRQIKKTTFNVDNSIQGETLATKLERITTNKEPIKDSAPMIYTDRKDGVLPDYDPRTDRFDVAIDAHDKITMTNLAKRQARHFPETGNQETGGGSVGLETGGKSEA